MTKAKKNVRKPQAVMPRRRRLKRLRRRGAMMPKDIYAMGKPIAVSTVSRGMLGKSLHVEGPTCEFLSVVATSAPNVSTGQILFSFLAGPALFPSTRLSALAQIYAQYRFRKFWVEFIPAAPTTADGSVALAIDKNIDAPLNSPSSLGSQANLAYIMDVQGSMTVPVYQPVRLDADCSVASTRQRMFFNDINAPLDEVAQFRILVAMAIPNTTLTSGFSFIIKVGYEVEFAQPLNSINTAQGIPPTLTYPTGTMFNLDATNGFAAAATTPPIVDSMLSNGNLYFVNPAICIGIEAGQPCIGAAIVSTKGLSTGSVPRLAMYKDLETARSQTAGNPGNGSVQGTGATVVIPSQINFIGVGQASLGYHT